MTTKVLFVGAYAYASDVLAAIRDAGVQPYVLTADGPGNQHIRGLLYSDEFIHALRPDLIIVAGWRRLIPPDVLAIPRLGTVGFHSAKLPEFPGRAPVPWGLLRGDDPTNTMLYLDEGVDSGDIIDSESRPLEPGDDPASVYRWMAASSVRLLRRHLDALLAGTARRYPQDLTRRGPLTTADGWSIYHARRGG